MVLYRLISITTLENGGTYKSTYYLLAGTPDPPSSEGFEGWFS